MEDGNTRLGHGGGRQTHRRPVPHASRSSPVPSLHWRRTTLGRAADPDLEDRLEHVGSCGEALSRSTKLQTLCLPPPQVQWEAAEQRTTFRESLRTGPQQSIESVSRTFQFRLHEPIVYNTYSLKLLRIAEMITCTAPNCYKQEL